MYARISVFLSAILATQAAGLHPVRDMLPANQATNDLHDRTTHERAYGAPSSPRSEPISTIHRGQENDIAGLIQKGDCVFSAWDELYITDFLQEQLGYLSTSDHCWIIKGVRGLQELLRRNITANPLNNVTIPTCVSLNITSKGNSFSIDFSTNSYEVNGVAEDTFVLLTYVHLVCMTAAFFLAYPIILVLASTPSLCIMIDRPLQEPTKAKIDRWQIIFQTFVFAPLMIGGLVTGIIGMGTSDHARTEHGIVGYITIGLAAIVVPLYLYQRRLSSRPDLTFYMYRRMKFINALDFIVCQAILVISGFALPDGIDDFGVMTLCGTNTISTSLIFSLGMIVSFVWNCAMATMTVQWLLSQRLQGGTFRDRAPPWMLKVLRKRSI
ncbi:bzip transcription factor [Colletotrichum asianum]